MDYGLIGELLPHSFSKDIHNLFDSYKYDIKELNLNNLEQFLRDKKFKGINVTIPYKEKVIDYIDELSEEAERIGAVNTILNSNGKLIGYNTDCFGFESLLKKNNIDICNKKVLVLGSGGTSKTVHYVLEKLSADKIVVVSRNPSDCHISYKCAYNDCSDFDIIVNTTPCGMYPNINSIPIDLSVFNNLSAVIDVIYNPINTNLVLTARERGVKAVGGLYMLVSQAVLSSMLFTGNQADFDINDIYNTVYKNKRNIVLIGMPGSGKTTLGKRLAYALNKKFVDVDDLIEDEMNMTIDNIFNNFGESYFRHIESKVIEKISDLNDSVISTGGGVVLNEDNMKFLKLNGIIIYINRNVNDICLDNKRPLVHSIDDLKQIHSVRSALYEKYSDFSFECLKDINKNLIELEKMCLL